jgi:hypothetical protein
VAAHMIDMEFQPGVALGDPTERRHVTARKQPDRQAFPLAGGPEPVERTVGPPALLMWLVEREAETEHAGPLAPILNDVLAVRALQVEMPEDAELIGVPAHRLDGQLVDLLAQRAGWMYHRCVDSGLGHFLQRVV